MSWIEWLLCWVAGAACAVVLWRLRHMLALRVRMRYLRAWRPGLRQGE